MEVTIQYKNIKHIHLHMDPRTKKLWVSAPYGTPEKVIRDFVDSKERWLERKMDLPSVDPSDEVQREFKQYVKMIAPYIERKMGLKAARYDFRNMKSRWGSCNPQTGRICLNLQLAGFSEDCVIYVIVHELAHLKIAGHTPEFWKLVETYVPNYREIRRMMR